MVLLKNGGLGSGLVVHSRYLESGPSWLCPLEVGLFLLIRSTGDSLHQGQQTMAGGQIRPLDCFCTVWDLRMMATECLLISGPLSRSTSERAWHQAGMAAPAGSEWDLPEKAGSSQSVFSGEFTGLFLTSIERSITL